MVDARGTSWLAGLSDEDLAFVKRFLLASGSLKAVAKEYGISYPTVRLRLDRLIEKVKILDSQESLSEFERFLRVLCTDGAMDLATAKAVLTEHRKAMEAGQ